MVPHKRRVTHSHKRSIKCTVKSLAHMKPTGELQIKQLFNVWSAGSGAKISVQDFSNFQRVNFSIQRSVAYSLKLKVIWGMLGTGVWVMLFAVSLYSNLQKCDNLITFFDWEDDFEANFMVNKYTGPSVCSFLGFLTLVMVNLGSYLC